MTEILIHFPEFYSPLESFIILILQIICHAQMQPDFIEIEISNKLGLSSVKPRKD